MRWLKVLVLRWLGLDNATALLAGLRTDHDAHTTAIQTQTEVVERAVGLLNQTNTVAMSAHSRLSHYENVVVPIRGAFRALQERAQREQRRAEAAAKLAAGPTDPPRPDMSEDVASA